jgi:hypothetical protein
VTAALEAFRMPGVLDNAVMDTAIRPDWSVCDAHSWAPCVAQRVTVPSVPVGASPPQPLLQVAQLPAAFTTD